MNFETNIRSIYGEKGIQWLARLPSLIIQIASQWNLRDLTPYPELTYNYVVKGWQENVPIVLKAGIDLAALQQEHAALHAFKGNGIISPLFI